MLFFSGQKELGLFVFLLLHYQSNVWLVLSLDVQELQICCKREVSQSSPILFILFILLKYKTRYPFLHFLMWISPRSLLCHLPKLGILQGWVCNNNFWNGRCRSLLGFHGTTTTGDHQLAQQEAAKNEFLYTQKTGERFYELCSFPSYPPTTRRSMFFGFLRIVFCQSLLEMITSLGFMLESMVDQGKKRKNSNHPTLMYDLNAQENFTLQKLCIKV